MHAFFPDPWFGWSFLAVLFLLLGVAAWKDFQTMMVPKWLTVPALGLGILFNVVRGIWLSYESLPTWILGNNGCLVGGLDGLLFSLLGFLVGFGLFFLMWILGVCGGGDVKLFAALGAWIGPGLTVSVLVATIVVVFCFIFVRLILQLFSGDWKSFQRTANAGKRFQRSRELGRQPRRRALSFALPLAIAVLLVMPWTLRVDLRLVPAPQPDVAEREHAHAP